MSKRCGPVDHAWQDFGDTPDCTLQVFCTACGEVRVVSPADLMRRLKDALVVSQAFSHEDIHVLLGGEP